MTGTSATVWDSSTSSSKLTPCAVMPTTESALQGQVGTWLQALWHLVFCLWKREFYQAEESSSGLLPTCLVTFMHRILRMGKLGFRETELLA